MSSAWTFHIVTLGCKINQYESQAIREAWQGFGGREVPLEELPNVFLINSCAITARGERDTRHALYRLQRAQKNQENTALRILTGCAAHLVDKSFAEQNAKHDDSLEGQTFFDVLIPPRAKALLTQDPRLLKASCLHENHSIPEFVNPFGENGFSIKSFHRVRPVLKVQDGCSHRCTYCIVPLVRGKSISRPPMEIVEEAQRLLESGHREIMLSGINLHQYGLDLPQIQHKNWDFWDVVLLLEEHLAKEWQGRARLRISSLEPSQLNSKGLEALTSSSLLCPHLHLSLQHGSPAVLKKMGRGHYKLSELKEVLQKLRKHWPLMGLGADILMGFAGENEDDVLQTLELIKEIGLSYAHVFPYSIRPGTAAAQFASQVPHALKIERAARVRALIEEQKNAFLQTLLQEKSLLAVFDGADDEDEPSSSELVKGIDAHYAPITLTAPPKNLHGIVSVKPARVQDGMLMCHLSE